tara:strand:+ start:2046 stop:2345 length:300 start_codon:yes stop_codon:yes gene_type:complete
MANSIEKMFDTNGSTLGVPVSPANPQAPDAVSIVGNSLLHNQYSNIGDPTLNNPAYDNFGAGAMGYTNPSTSQLGEQTQAYQEPVNRYANNLPDGAAGI